MSRILQIKALIVDDEPLARDRIRELLKEHPEIEVIGEARNGQEAINTIVNHNPDLVFLDVQMPDLDGFDVLQNLNVEQLPLIIFVTAYYTLSRGYRQHFEKFIKLGP